MGSSKAERNRGSLLGIYSREDFKLYCKEKETSISEEFKKWQEVRQRGVAPFPFHCKVGNIKIAMSEIEGEGLYTLEDIHEGDAILPLYSEGQPTLGGYYINHTSSERATVYPILADDGLIYIIAKITLTGGKGGIGGTELLVDYREVDSCYEQYTKRREKANGST